MNRYSKHLTAAIALAFGLLSVTTLWAADETDTAANASSIRVTNFRGHPPFKRRFLSSEETAELARFEESSSEPTAESVRTADYRGRPPFQRKILSSEEVADLARFEEASSSGEEVRSRRRGPPGKPGARR
ncbi:MAG: hypothetical protein HKN13_04360 [Rhodothermales bacterium]|nr:hypothetical protein [Rhodothermales bacterium]